MSTDTWKRSTPGEPIRVNEGDVPFLSFPLLEETGIVRHGFSTRMGGVSEGIYASMNLGYRRGDEPENVAENFRRITAAMGMDADRMVFSAQTHTTNLLRVTSADVGLPAWEVRHDIDGLLTDEEGLVLVTFYADCIPLYFVDPVHRAIALSHSGWRGTRSRMGEATVRRMAEEFGSRPEDILAAVGPGICQDCYEVGEEVAAEFREAFSWGHDVTAPGKAPGKYQLDLWEANRRILTEAGIAPEHLAVSNLCTCCNADKLFSHRASKGKRGSLAAFLSLKEKGK